MLRGCIRDILGQSYPLVNHGVNCSMDLEQIPAAVAANAPILFDDLSSSERLKIVFNQNSHNHINFLNALKAYDNFQDFDLFVKIDDDDIYKTDYVKNIVEFMARTKSDICSSKTKWELNGFNLWSNLVSNLGGNPEGTDYHLPPTFAFNKKALKAILSAKESELIGWEDKVWRLKWAEAGLKHSEIDNTDQFIWNIHGSNGSIGHWLKIGADSFDTHLEKTAQAYEKSGRYKDIVNRIWNLDEKLFVLEASMAPYEIVVAVHSRDLTKLKVEVFDKSKKLKLEQAYYGFDFTTGNKITIFEAGIKKEEDYLTIAHAIDTLLDEVVRIQNLQYPR
jgi:hypothetical protein